MALHARALEFVHPKTSKKIKIEAPLPSYWDEIWLRGLQALN